MNSLCDLLLGYFSVYTLIEFSTWGPILGESSEVSTIVLTMVVEPLGPATEALAPEEDLVPTAEIRALATDPVTRSSVFYVVGPSEPVPKFLLQRVPVSTLLSIARGNFECVFIFQAHYIVLWHFNLSCRLLQFGVIYQGPGCSGPERWFLCLPGNPGLGHPRRERTEGGPRGGSSMQMEEEILDGAMETTQVPSKSTTYPLH